VPITIFGIHLTQLLLLLPPPPPPFSPLRSLIHTNSPGLGITLKFSPPAAAAARFSLNGKTLASSETNYKQTVHSLRSFLHLI
jgi:hypothetical protein